MKRRRSRISSNELGTKPLETLVPGREPVLLTSYYASYAGYYPTCELQTKRALSETVGVDWVCIDAGANIGYHSILMSQLARDGIVIAFEPTGTFDLLVRNLKANGASNVRAERLALADKSGERSEALYRIWGQPPEVARYEFTTIDEYIKATNLTRVDLIKIDVDGFDLEVLRGAEETIDRFKPVVIVELNEALKTRGESPADVLTYMLDCKYDRALVLDKENYLFTSTWELGAPWPSELRVSIDRRDPLYGERIAIEEILADNLSPLLACNGARLEKIEKGFRFSIDAPAWSYAVSQQISPNYPGQLGIEVSGELHDGKLGILVASSDGSSQISDEETITQPGAFSVTLPVPSEKASLLVLRTVMDDPLSAQVTETRFVQIKRDSNEVSSLSELSRLDLANVLGVIPGSDWTDFPLESIRTISTEDLSKIFNQGAPKAPCPTPQLLMNPADLVMERDDAPILQWLYQQLQPEFHLEFGTWEGFGTCLCLTSTQAKVWTVNLPTGESSQTGNVYTRSREPFDSRNPRPPASVDPSDSGEAVGWMYKVLGLRDRVTQLMQDSRTLQNVREISRTFDTVFIDGSHERNVVRSDQDFALRTASQGGTLIWHDFTLDPQVLRSQKACTGVISAIADDTRKLVERGSLYWIRDTLLLLLVLSRESSPGPRQNMCSSGNG